MYSLVNHTIMTLQNLPDGRLKEILRSILYNNSTILSRAALEQIMVSVLKGRVGPQNVPPTSSEKEIGGPGNTVPHIKGQNIGSEHPVCACPLDYMKTRVPEWLYGYTKSYDIGVSSEKVARPLPLGEGL